MIKINGEKYTRKYFPDGTALMQLPEIHGGCVIQWNYECDEELVDIIYLAKHFHASPDNLSVILRMPYIPNARQDRVKTGRDVFTLKYFAEIINSLKFDWVKVLDPHSPVSEALIDNMIKMPINIYVNKALEQINISPEDLTFYYPDEGAAKRYAADGPTVFGIKNRDWETGEIKGLDIHGDVTVEGKTILMVDDICAYGGTMYHSAKKLKEMGAGDVYMYVTHCENSILEGDLINSGLVKKIFTTDSIFNKEHPLIEVMEVEY